MNGAMTSYRCRSDPHSPVDVIRTIASVGSWIVGSGTFSTRTSRLPFHTTAFMIASGGRDLSPYPHVRPRNPPLVAGSPPAERRQCVLLGCDGPSRSAIGMPSVPVDAVDDEAAQTRRCKRPPSARKGAAHPRTLVQRSESAVLTSRAPRTLRRSPADCLQRSASRRGSSAPPCVSSHLGCLNPPTAYLRASVGVVDVVVAEEVIAERAEVLPPAGSPSRVMRTERRRGAIATDEAGQQRCC